MLAQAVLIGLLSLMPPPSDCPVGYVCLSIEEAARLNTRLIELEGEVEILKVKRSLFGWCAGVGGGVDFDFEDVEMEPSVGAYITYGIRW